MAHKIQENLFLTFTVGYFVCLATMQGLCDLSSSTRDQTPRACSENRSHWSTYPLWFMVKNTAQESQVEEIHRPRRVRSFHALSRQTTLPSPPHVHQPEFSLREWSWVSSFWVLTEASLHRQDWLSHWPFIVQPPAPLPSLEVRELGRTKSSNLQIIWFFPLKTSPHLWVFSKSHLTNMTKTSLSLSSLKKFQQL